MSRLIVKNLPKGMTEGKLSKEFATQGQVTDCQLKYTPDGVFRKFAFVGYATDAEAESAKEFFHGSYLGTAKIVVEVCRPLGAADKPRAWSKYSVDSSAFQRKAKAAASQDGPPDPQPPKKDKKKKSKDQKTPAELKADPKWAEFIQLAKGEKAGEEGKGEGEEASEEPSQGLESLKGQAAASGATSALLLSGLPAKVKVGSVKEFIAPVRLKTAFLHSEEGALTASALLTFNRPGDQKRVLKKSGEFFGGFKITVEEMKLEPPEKEEEAVEDPASQEPSQEAAIEQVSETGRIFVKNLSYFVKEEDLEAHFRKFGEIAEVVIPVDLRTHKSKGYGLVTFVFPEHAVKAFTEADGGILQGRMVHLLPGKEKPGDEAAKKASTVKAAKAAAHKAQAAKGHNWNSLFVGGAAVGDAMAAELGVDKAELLSSDAQGSLGVRLALGETHVVRETRRFLLSHGVAIDLFGKPDAKRSAHVILAKNLPAGSTVEELTTVFGKFGELGRVLLPPSGVSALIEFLEPAPAKQAFKAIAYTRFKSRPFFLEWAPEDVFSAPIDPDEDPKEEKKDGEEKAEKPKKEAEPEDPSPGTSDDKPSEPGSRLFVKNLNFETEDADLARRFAKMGPLLGATVATKPNPKRPGERLSCGFGFVEFQRSADAERALKELQGCLLHNHALQLRLARRDAADSERPSAAAARPSAAPQTQGECTKLLVRNVAFQASEAEVRELFAAFGHLRFVRMPKKVGAREHRGFAFVDFASKAEAGRAFAALATSTHLYGRRLVLEWAHQEEEGLDEVRKRTNAHFVTGEHRARAAKSKKRLLDTLEA